MWNDAYAWAERILAALVGGAVSYLVTFFAGTLRERKNEKAIRALEGLVSNVNARIDDLCSRLNSAKGTDKLKDADGSEGGNEHDDQATAAAPKSVAKSRWDGFEAHIAPFRRSTRPSSADSRPRTAIRWICLFLNPRHFGKWKGAVFCIFFPAITTHYDAKSTPIF